MTEHSPPSNKVDYGTLLGEEVRLVVDSATHSAARQLAGRDDDPVNVHTSGPRHERPATAPRGVTSP
ncbi:hypothetical protein [Streptomyces sp. NPDC127098]|uniref:hypothetical protein n=1 Tax=Streptomyces sp. NPDC127098 TaxID=3347137 RepID=UPI0036699816